MLKVNILLSTTAEDGLDPSKLEALYIKAEEAKNQFLESLSEFNIVEKSAFKISISEKEE